MLWEAQYGDFANGAQIVIDQFISSGLSKWRETSRLTLLLPHGYEGNGPEHSSARLERFLQLAAQENLRVVNCTTAAQYFHLLRRQALDATARPLVVVTPKGLLRLKEATSTIGEFVGGGFRPVIDDARIDKRRGRAARPLQRQGVLRHRRARGVCGGGRAVAVARIEQLYPFPTEAVAALVASYPWLEEVVWAQEEPQNMGPWRSIRHRLEEAASGRRLRFVGRPWRASPSEGYPTAHLIEQDRIVREAVTRACIERRRRAARVVPRRGLREGRRGVRRDLRRRRPRLRHMGHVVARRHRLMARDGGRLVRLARRRARARRVRRSPDHVGDDTAVLSAFVDVRRALRRRRRARSMNNRLDLGPPQDGRDLEGRARAHVRAGRDGDRQGRPRALTSRGGGGGAFCAATACFARRGPCLRAVTQPSCAAASAACARDPTT